jgi:predicted membrane protein
MKAGNIFIGLGLICAAVILILDALGVVAPLIGIIGGISAFEIIAGLLLVALIVERLIRGKISSIFFLLGFLFMLFEENIAYICHLENENIINNWLVMLIALLLTVGFDILLSSCKRRRQLKHFGGSVSTSANNKYAESNLGSSTVYIDCTNFSPAFVENNLGSCSVFFENIDSYKGGETLRVTNHLGSMQVNVPECWSVHVTVDNNMGATFFPTEQEDGDKKILYIVGENDLGSLRVDYV